VSESGKTELDSPQGPGCGFVIAVGLVFFFFFRVSRIPGFLMKNSMFALSLGETKGEISAPATHLDQDLTDLALFVVCRQKNTSGGPGRGKKKPVWVPLAVVQQIGGNNRLTE